jgi:transcriptional antiterminator NusG
MEKKRWYIVQTYSGFENSVKQDIERRTESMQMQDYIFQILIPEEIVEETKADGTKKQVVRKMFPGYVFIEMIVTDDGLSFVTLKK